MKIHILTLLLVILPISYAYSQGHQTPEEIEAYKKAKVKTKSTYSRYRYNWSDDTNGVLQNKKYYDENGLLVKEESYLGLPPEVNATYWYTYDKNQRLTGQRGVYKQSPQSNGHIRFTYTAAGKQDSVIMYDSFGIRNLSYFKYDKRGILYEKVEIRPFSRDSSFTRYQYNKQGWLIKEIYLSPHTSGSSYRLYFYDKLGRETTSELYIDGKRIRVPFDVYDEKDRKVFSFNLDDNNDTLQVSRYFYTGDILTKYVCENKNAKNFITHYTYGQHQFLVSSYTEPLESKGAHRAAYTYDKNGRLQQKELFSNDVVYLRHSFEYDGAGNLLMEKEDHINSMLKTRTYVYDGENRLVKSTTITVNYLINLMKYEEPSPRGFMQDEKNDTDTITEEYVYEGGKKTAYQLLTPATDLSGAFDYTGEYGIEDYWGSPRKLYHLVITDTLKTEINGRNIKYLLRIKEIGVPDSLNAVFIRTIVKTPDGNWTYVRDEDGNGLLLMEAHKKGDWIEGKKISWVEEKTGNTCYRSEYRCFSVATLVEKRTTDSLGRETYRQTYTTGYNQEWKTEYNGSRLFSERYTNSQGYRSMNLYEYNDKEGSVIVYKHGMNGERKSRTEIRYVNGLKTEETSYTITEYPENRFVYDFY